jgi:hypothetical protein
MVIITAAALAGATWLRYRLWPASELPEIGALAPPIRLRDLDTSEPLVLAGLRGKVVWVVFWSADSSTGRSSLPALERVWRRLKAHRKFAMVAAAVEADKPRRVRDAVAESGVELTVYLASAETRRRYGAEQADPPLHALIDAEGRISAMARGAGRQTIERIAEAAQRQLDELDPLGNTRFAKQGSRPSVHSGLHPQSDQCTLANLPKM